MRVHKPSKTKFPCNIKGIERFARRSLAVPMAFCEQTESIPQMLTIGTKEISGATYTAVQPGRYLLGEDGVPRQQYVIIRAATAGSNTSVTYWNGYGTSVFQAAWDSPETQTYRPAHETDAVLEFQPQTNTRGLPPLGASDPSSALPVSFATKVLITGNPGMTTGSNLLAADGASATAVEAYHTVLLQVVSTTGITAGVITFEQSLDNVSWLPLLCSDAIATNLNPVSTLTVAANTTRSFTAGLMGRFLRLRVSTNISGGSVRATAVLSQHVHRPLALNVQQATAANMLVTATPSGTYTVGGVAAHSAASSGNPVRVAGRVNTAADTTLAAGDASDLFMSTSGQLIVKPFAAAELDWQYTGVLTTATAVAARAAAAAGVRNYVTGLQYQNTSTTATTVLVLDNATTIAQFHAPANMAVPAVIRLVTPLRGTAATTLNVQCGTAGANLLINLQGYQGA